MASSSDEEVLDGVAVVGLAGRFPGAGSIDELWENLKAGRESVRVFTDEELAEAGIPQELIRDPAYVKARGLIDQPEAFDAAFFGISPREAELMDPQHRLFLETCWHALENAGYAPASVDGRVGVWGGMSTGMSNDTYLHSNLGGPRGVPEEDVLSAMLGNENDYLTTRVSYKLNLRGPSVNVQTACSTSLVAVVQAFQSLMTWGCDVALAGGVSVSYPQKGGYLHQEGGIGSPDGHCRPFDAEARGTVFSNGVGVAVLKRLEDALEDGDTILAVVRGAASNNDGAAKVSFAAPSVTGQAEVIASALAVADVEPSSVTYVETHGTGTPIGDPIEVEGLTRAFRRGTDETGFCALGSIKSNFGHLDSAAGIAGFIKAVLSLRHRTLVPTVHFTTPSPRIDWASTPFYVNAETRPWTTDRLPLRAGVSAFGIGGTNAHVVLEEAPARTGSLGVGGPQVVPISARTPESLAAAARRLDEHLEGHDGLHLRDVAGTLQEGREAFRHRSALVASDLGEVRDILASGDAARLVTGDAGTAVDGTVFLFPGGGAQYVGMGRDLYEAHPSFREEVDRGIALMRDREGVDLRPVWFAEAGDAAADEAFQRPSVQLPALFILEMALARQLVRWGVEPVALIGHSMGENTAACLAGVLSYEDALGLVALRGRLFDTAAAGGMLSVTADAGTVRARLAPELDLAAVNGPEQCTVSGPRAAIDALAAELEADGIDARVVPIDIAAHSSLVDPLLEPFEAYLRSVELHPPRIPFASNRTGTWITDAEATDPAYWASHLRGTVRFADDVRTVLDEGHRFFLEVGPGRILTSLVKLSDPAVGPRVAATMRHPREETADDAALLGAVARLWVAGGEVDWARIRGEAPFRRVPLPGYAFERRPFLIEPGRTAGTPRAPEPRLDVAPGSPTSPDVLQRILELQARTNAAIQALLSGSPAPREPRSASVSDGSQPPADGPSSAGAGEPSERFPRAAESERDAADPVPEPEAPTGAGLPDRFFRTATRGEASVPVEARTAFWRERLEGPLPRLELMADGLRTPEGLLRRGSVERTLDPGVVRSVASVAAEAGVEPRTVALAGVVALLQRATGQDDLLIAVPPGSPGAADPSGRGGLPLRIRPDAGETFVELVRRIDVALGEGERTGAPDLNTLQDVLELPRDPARAPLVQVRFAWGEALQSAGAGDPPPDLAVGFTEGADGVQLVAEYAEGLYAPATMKDLLAHLEVLLEAAASAPRSALASLPASAPGGDERLRQWEDRPTEALPDVDLAAWLTERWASVPDALAVVAGRDRLTYAELDARSNRLANHLVAAGVRPGGLVGLCLERTADLVVALVAAWKAGAGYVPMDPGHPPARLALISRRADLDAVVTVSALADRVADDGSDRILLDRDREAIDARSAERPALEADLSRPAYILFTSGSTGEPKGVRVPARAVMHLIRTLIRRPGLGPSDVILGATTFTFDISVLELFAPLRLGGTLVLATSDDAKDGAALARLMEEHGVTVAQFTPTGWRILQAAAWQGRPLKAISGGEPVPRDLLRWMLPRVSEFWNGYGPTEATVYTSFAHLRDADAPIHIGPPLPGFRAYVLDSEGRRVPPGVPGELYLGGIQIADGYVGRPEETSRRFLPDPFHPGGRMYRTGDLVRWRRDGVLDHLGRLDEQVKLRGFRIELGEVETVLSGQPEVQGAAVVLADLDGSPELVGYVVTSAWNERSLRERLARTLPDYMVPRFLVPLEELPLTTSGKTDRKALPDPRSVTMPVAPGLARPETEAEVYLAEVWREILEVPELSVEDNFFDLGGHSLLAVRAIARVRDERVAEIPLRALMTGTLRLIARDYLSGDGTSPSGEGGEDNGTVSRVFGTVRDWMSR
ncbi:MAG TPA: amino acid adenylation domain-containing protein [Longimicrobiales bacterium]|nr:amino acid adenylation domain-containing protein [Longimicrobiales bacterium]